MRAYCAAMAPRMSELMGSASKQDQEIRQDAMTPNDAAHNTNLYYIFESADRRRSAGHRAKQSGGQWNGSLASNGDALGSKSVFQVSFNAASHLVSKLGHKQVLDCEQQSETPWLIRSIRELCFAIYQTPL